MFKFDIATKIVILEWTGKSIYHWIKYRTDNSDTESCVSQLFFSDKELEGVQHCCIKPDCNCVGSWETGSLRDVNFVVYFRWNGEITHHFVPD